MVMCLARSHTQGAIFDAPEFANSIRPFLTVICVRKTAYKANHMRPNKWVTLFSRTVTPSRFRMQSMWVRGSVCKLSAVNLGSGHFW